MCLMMWCTFAFPRWNQIQGFVGAGCLAGEGEREDHDFLGQGLHTPPLPTPTHTSFHVYQSPARAVVCGFPPGTCPPRYVYEITLNSVTRSTLSCKEETTLFFFFNNFFLRKLESFKMLAAPNSHFKVVFFFSFFYSLCSCLFSCQKVGRGQVVIREVEVQSLITHPLGLRQSLLPQQPQKQCWSLLRSCVWSEPYVQTKERSLSFSLANLCDHFLWLKAMGPILGINSKRKVSSLCEP